MESVFHAVGGYFNIFYGRFALLVINMVLHAFVMGKKNSVTRVKVLKNILRDEERLTREIGGFCSK